jgi:niacin transporter
MNMQKTVKLTISGLLIAIGVIIPMFSPLRLVIPPASFTLASHVAIFIAMFISPAMAVSVAAGTAIGFYLGGFPLIIVMRAATHAFFALIGALYLSRHKKRISAVKLRFFSLCAASVHALGEVAVVTVFFFGGNISQVHLEQGFAVSVLLLVGLGTVIHSMVDFEIAQIVLYPLKKQKSLASYFDRTL